MQRYEYSIFTLSVDKTRFADASCSILTELNKRGREGWLLVSHTVVDKASRFDLHIWTFKRRLVFDTLVLGMDKDDFEVVKRNK